MKKLGRKGIALVLCAVLMTVFCFSGLAFGATESQLREDLSDVKQEQDELSKKMTQVEQEVKDVQAKVDALTSQINQSAEEIASTEKKIKAKEQEMEEQETNLNARLKVMYKSGSLGFIDVLLGSGSISEFVSNLEIIQKIYKNDMDVLETLEKEHEARYRCLIEQLQSGKVFTADGEAVWICRNCGYIHHGQSAPLVCPVCKKKQAYFERRCKNG